MAIKEIIQYPAPVLQQRCSPVTGIDSCINSLITDLIDTMKASPGVALAAPQIGILLRAIVIDVTPRNPGRGLIALLNPEILKLENEKAIREGCLSIPGYTANIKRAQRVFIRGLDAEGAEIEFESTGMEAVALQHEIDHLEGILFLDRIANMKRDLFRRKSF